MNDTPPSSAPASAFILAMPNIITGARILLTPVVALFILREQSGMAMIMLAITSLSDRLDGAIARRFNAHTRLGAYLDPLADKALILLVYASLAAVEMADIWLAALIIGRDMAMMFLGGLTWIAYRRVWAYGIIPLSRAATTGQMILGGLILMQHYLALPVSWPAAAGYFDFALALIIAAVIALTFAAGLLYFWRWLLFVGGYDNPYDVEDNAK